MFFSRLPVSPSVIGQKKTAVLLVLCRVVSIVQNLGFKHSFEFARVTGKLIGRPLKKS